MLGILTNSTIRRKILVLFVYNKEKEFYLSEIARHVMTSAGTTQRELNKLVQADFLEFRKIGNLSYYRLNRKYSLLNEVETIIRKTYGVEVELKAHLEKIEGVRAAFLFGSYVTGQMKSDSDIDLFIIGAPDEDDVFRAVEAVEASIGREIGYHLMGEDEFKRKARANSFIKEIITEPLFIVGTKDELEELAG